MTKKISFIIKALNEEDNIAKCIESCLREAEGYESEIILVDSLSTDRTVEIAKEYPITIIQFLNRCDASCGSAPQLGYQYSTGEYIFLIDGDMECISGFLSKAIQYLDKNLEVAGVGGMLVDTQVSTAADRRRVNSYCGGQGVREVNCLGGGGLYRRSAIDDVGYFSHRGLSACEEIELGVRLRDAGWQLLRIDLDSIFHTGHVESDLAMLLRVWKNGRMASHGQFLRSSIGERWWWLAVKAEWYVFMPLLINSFILMFLFFLFSINVLNFSIMFFTLIALLGCLKRSLKEALLSFLSWHIAFLASVKYIFIPASDPYKKIEYTIL